MPDTMTPDTVRAELLRAASEALRRAAPALPAGADTLMRHLHAGIPTHELAALRPEDVAAAAASLWSLAAQRPPGVALVRVQPGSGARVVAEVVTDDMPFLVDSALAALAPGGTVHRLLHPVLPVSRDGEGRLLSLWSEGPAESMMRIEFSPTRSAGDGMGEGAEAALRRAMADVRVATADFGAMLDALGQATTEVAAAPAGGEVAQAFLRWLTDDNYVLLGHRRVAVQDGALSVVTAENLGLLRDPEVVAFDTMRDLGAILPAVRAAFMSPEPVTVAKANLRSTVHRPQHGDAIVTRTFDASEAVTGVRVFFGLFAATAYTRNPRSIPMLAQKVDSILASSGVDGRSHDGRALRQALDTWPRDELFQAPEAAILHGARRSLDLQLRPRAALVVRHDPFERFVSVIAWLPRDVFDTRLRERVGAMLARAYGGRLSAFHIALGDTPLARIHYIVGTTPGAVPPVDADALEAAVAEAARDFRDRLQESLADAEGEAAASRIMARWSAGLPTAYRDTATAAQGVADLALAERAVETGRATTALSRPPGSPPGHLVLRLVQPGGALPLADVLPLLESLDLRAIQEVPHEFTRPDGPPVVLHVFTVQAAVPPSEAVYPVLLHALAALLDGRAEVDGFNRLSGRAGLTWRECWLLRTLYRWLKQVGLPFSQSSVEAALAGHPQAARILVDLHHARFAPDGDRGAEAGLMEQWTALLDSVANPDEDRILSRMMTLLRAVLRSGFYADKPYIALKISSADAGDMPAPRPWREVFIHSPRMEGCHLRAGPVARGGIRWSDRREDFRTEILGLMKAQRLKNVVIVPTGAKGGFVLKQAPSPADREAFMAEGVACYRMLINGMLDMADTLQGEAVVTPPGIVRRDGDDPYMVAAADKGTATFSDIANGIAVERGFWLGDAFASGGSQGYDHKVMGITARGAWVMIARHFAELGLDIQADPFTCVGVGDMSGDVFGNGLLVSRQTRLLAAFDHRHIFLDPNPDPHASYDERARLFALPRSSWADYDRALISPGGGVFSRLEKRIPLSPEVQAMLGLDMAQAEPAVVMQAILRAPADLLYFGGIGTYVKASTESQADAGDRANDALRVDGATIRARVMGEGANLAITQAGRIEYARSGAGGQGGRLNTDALDNSAGVSTSDHEVNIKILLADAERDGVLTRRQRDDLLAAMTDEVAALVLRDNTQQALAVSLELRDAAADLPSHAALMARLEREGLLDRAVAGLPDAAALKTRMAAGAGLLRPEVAALLPVAKLWLTEAIDENPLLDDPAFEPMLLGYFPTPLRTGFAPYALRHRLRRDLVATLLVNGVCNRLGPAALARLANGTNPADVLRAAWLAAAPFDLDALCDAVDAAAAPAAVRLDALATLRRLHEVLARDQLGTSGPLDAAVAALRPGIGELQAGAARAAAGSPQALALQAAGLPLELAALVAAAPALAAAPAIVRLAGEAGVPPSDAASAWQRVGQGLGIEALRAAALPLAVPGAFGAQAKAALLTDLLHTQARLARMALAGTDPATMPGAGAAAGLARDAATTPDLAALTVAARALGALGQAR